MKKKIVLILMTTALATICLTGCKMSDYKTASELQEQGQYVEALALYESIEDYVNYKDTAEKVDFCKRMISAIEQFDASKVLLEEKNNALDTVIKEAEDLIAKKETPLDDTFIPALETLVSEAKAAKLEIPEMPSLEEEIIAISKTMDEVDYTLPTNNLLEGKKALEKSIKQYALVYQPSESYIIECLAKVEHVKNISAVTEDNDPNGKLNKAGGYTATVYYSDDRINLNKNIYGKTIIEQGTQGGGGIEVYATVEDAEKRNEYLASFDGSVFSSGSHTVIGTTLIRTSDELTASQQKEMEAKIIEILTYVE